MVNVTFIEIIIAALSGFAIYLTQHKKESRNRLACLFGLSSQPLWLYFSFVQGQYFLLLLNLYCTYSWSIGFNKYYIEPYHWDFEWFPANQEDFGYYEDYFNGTYHRFSLKLFAVTWYLK